MKRFDIPPLSSFSAYSVSTVSTLHSPQSPQSPWSFSSSSRHRLDTSSSSVVPILRDRKYMIIFYSSPRMYFKEAEQFKKIHFKNEWVPICCCLQTLTAPDLCLDTQCLSDRPVFHDLSREKSTCLSSIRQLRCNLILFFDRKMNGFQFQCPSKRLWVARKRGACEIKVSRRTVRSVTSLQPFGDHKVYIRGHTFFFLRAAISKPSYTRCD